MIDFSHFNDEAVFRFNTKEMKESDRFGYMFGKAMDTCYYKDVKMSMTAQTFAEFQTIYKENNEL